MVGAAYYVGRLATRSPEVTWSHKSNPGLFASYAFLFRPFLLINIVDNIYRTMGILPQQAIQSKFCHILFSRKIVQWKINKCNLQWCTSSQYIFFRNAKKNLFICEIKEKYWKESFFMITDEWKEKSRVECHFLISVWKFSFFSSLFIVL